MCTHKKGPGKKKNLKKSKSPARSAPKSKTPTASTLAEQMKEEKKAKEALKNVPNAENLFATPIDSPVKEENQQAKTPLRIKVPPPRVLKARRRIKVVRDPRDPEYKTLEPDFSEWESVKIMKRSEFKNNENEAIDGVVQSGFLTIDRELSQPKLLAAALHLLIVMLHNSGPSLARVLMSVACV
ncbi:hypothetical protein RB195_015556 [Necator americanus]|uniref:Uncharacterized protein n=1 Tax=Necator americanus TaxID=51031 RepID=A0ABR1E584_NECAM